MGITKKTHTKQFKKLFQTNPLKKAEMLGMVRQGLLAPDIAKHFGVDRTSIIYYRRQYGLNGLVKVGRPKSSKGPTTYQKDLSNTPFRGFVEVDGERVCLGKSYSEYVMDEKAKKEKGSKFDKLLR